MIIFKSVTLQKLKKAIRLVLGFILNPRFLLCFGIAWMITNGWAYVMLGLGIFFNVFWMQALGGSYLGLVWIPMTPEKIATLAIAIFLLRFLFPKDQKTLGVLIEIKSKTISAIKRKKDKKF